MWMQLPYSVLRDWLAPSRALFPTIKCVLYYIYNLIPICLLYPSLPGPIPTYFFKKLSDPDPTCILSTQHNTKYNEERLCLDGAMSGNSVCMALHLQANRRTMLQDRALLLSSWFTLSPTNELQGHWPNQVACLAWIHHCVTSVAVNCLLDGFLPSLSLFLKVNENRHAFYPFRRSETECLAPM